MKKLIISVFMFAMIAGASVNSTANATLAETPGVVATPNLVYCLWGHESGLVAGGVMGTLVGGGTTTGLFLAGKGILISVGVGSGIGAVILGAGI